MGRRAVRRLSRGASLECIQAVVRAAGCAPWVRAVGACRGERHAIASAAMASGAHLPAAVERVDEHLDVRCGVVEGPRPGRAVLALDHLALGRLDPKPRGVIVEEPVAPPSVVLAERLLAHLGRWGARGGRLGAYGAAGLLQGCCRAAAGLLQGCCRAWRTEWSCIFSMCLRSCLASFFSMRASSSLRLSRSASSSSSLRPARSSSVAHRLPSADVPARPACSASSMASSRFSLSFSRMAWMSAAVAILRRLPSTVAPMSSLAEAGGLVSSCFAATLASSSRALRSSLSSFFRLASNSFCCCTSCRCVFSFSLVRSCSSTVLLTTSTSTRSSESLCSRLSSL